MFRVLFLVPKKICPEEKNNIQNFGLFAMSHWRLWFAYEYVRVETACWRVDGFRHKYFGNMFRHTEYSPQFLLFFFFYDLIRCSVWRLLFSLLMCHSKSITLLNVLGLGFGLILFQFAWNFFLHFISAEPLWYRFCCAIQHDSIIEWTFLFSFINEACYLVCFLAYWWDAWVSVGCLCSIMGNCTHFCAITFKLVIV